MILTFMKLGPETITKVVPRLKLKYLFTNLGINFEPQRIRNLHILCNIIMINLTIFGSF